MAAFVRTRVVSWKEAADSTSRSPETLGDTHQVGTGRGRLAVLGDDPAVLGLEPGPLDQLTGQQLGVAGLDDRDPLQHLADDHLDVLVVDTHALAAVHVLHLVDQVHLDRTRPEDAQHLLRSMAPMISFWPTSTC